MSTVIAQRPSRVPMAMACRALGLNRGTLYARQTRHAGRILKTAMQMAVPKGLNHLPDDLLQQAIEALR